MSAIHKPVLLNEIIVFLNPEPGQNFIDCTFGGGGHSAEIIKKIGPKGKLLAIDADPKTEVGSRVLGAGKAKVIFVNDNFRNLEKIVAENFSYPVKGILLDLGLSSDQLENSGRGFTFQKDEPLDMRFDEKKETTAAEILNFGSLDYLINIFKNYGELRQAEKLARKVVENRKCKKFQTTYDLIMAVEEAGVKARSPRINSATLVFQALRIAVNDELNALKNVLPSAEKILTPSGRLAVISFQALEDRIVKNYFRDGARAKRFKLLTKKPVVPTRAEVLTNPRSRSAKLRVIEKI
jgi:16S rRNA (cytosine1402-N4)-methyltransferase